MKIVYKLHVCTAVILNYIELSSQSRRPAESTARLRSRSPTIKETFPGVLGFGFEDLELIRLRPYNCPDRVFELRRYVFPPDKPIGLKTRSVNLNPMPTGEQIVLSTSDGDAYAILGRSACGTTILRAIFAPSFGRQERAKMNMNSGVVTALTAEEIQECPVSTQAQIAKRYAISLSNSESEGLPDSNSDPAVHGRASSSSARSSAPAELPLRNRSRSPTVGQTFSTVFGYALNDLEFIRLIPEKHPHRKFKLRRYTFPQDKPIGLITNNRVLYSMPTGEQIALSRSNGDVCAILEKTRWRQTNVRPIFTSNSGVLERVKINMNSGAVEVMTTLEIAECPGCFSGQVRKIYNVVRL